MNEDLKCLLQQLITLLTAHHHHDSDCGCGCKCGCPTDNMFESTAARFNEQAAFASSQSQQNFVAQQQAQAAQLLKLQADVTKTTAGV